MTRHIFLIPGFFGFDTFGNLSYWEHARTFFQTHSPDTHLHLVPTSPTASIRTRALRLAIALQNAGLDPEKDEAHLIGHSTGALDARLLVTPAANLRTTLPIPQLIRPIRSVVSVSSPHFGAPLAALFTSILGQRLLQVLSLSTLHLIRFGRLPLSAVLKLAAILSATGANLRLNRTLLDQLFAQLLGDFTSERRDQLRSFFTDINDDQSLLLQLSPESLDLFNSACANNPNIRYGCVVTRAPAPSIRSSWSTGLDPYAQAMHSLYHGLYRVSGDIRKDLLPPVQEHHSRALQAAYQVIPNPSDNDGIIPTRSQLWGDVIACVQADHLDIIGHFDDPGDEHPHYDWLVTQSQFSRRDFHSVWTSIDTYLNLKPQTTL